MGNHESFLKMIGMSAESQGADADKSVKENGAKENKEDSWGTFDLQEKSQPTNSETEWEISGSAEVPDTETLEASQEEPAVEEGFVSEEPAEIQESSWENKTQDTESSTNSSSDSGELNAEFTEGFTRTERYDDGDGPQPTESTAVYTSDEIEQIGSEQIRGLTLTGVDKTRPTVPFNYEKSRVSRASFAETSEGRTAHFDYSRQQADHRIVVLEGKVSAQAFHLGQLPLRIGRDPQNEVVLDDVNASRFHAEVRETHGKLGIFDLGSTNGIKVNGKLVNEAELHCHDIIQVGDCLFEFLDPGVLSKGAPVGAIVSEGATSEFSVPRRKFKRFYLYGALGFIALAAFGLSKLLTDPDVRQAAEQKILEVAASAAQKEIEALRSMMEKTYQISIDRIDSQEVKKAFIERFEAKGLLNFSAEAKQQVEALPAQVIHLLVIYPEMFGEAVSAGGSPEAFASVLRRKINALIETQSFEQALKVTEVLLALSNDDPQVAEAYEKLKSIVARQQPKDDAAGAPTYTPAEQKFFAYMEEHENFVMKLIDENKTADAIRYSEIVTEKLAELVKQDPQYDRVAKDEIARWSDRIGKLEEKSKESKAKQKKDDTNLAAGDEALDQIQEAFDSGNMAETRKLTKSFLINFPKHPRIDEVKGTDAQIDQMVQRSFDATKASVETLMEQEGYENAWKELYRFMEVMPEYPAAVELKTALDKRATPKAAQFYNQARVFEFEADDLVAAEQYYKKTMEFADPESDLFKKAKRRFDEVKRKGIR